MSRPYKKLVCACCGKSEMSICINCIAKDIEELHKRIKKVEIKQSLGEKTDEK